jgi:hypothetical protein
MSEEMMNHGHSGHETEYEHEDLGSRGIFVFMIALAVSGAVIYFIIVGMYSFLDKYERSQMTTGSPLVSPAGEMSRVVTQEQMDKMFKDNGAPMLETNERGQFREFLIDQEDQLNSYGWVDKSKGVAHIPIERAMELVVQRGLPTVPQGGADVKTAADSKTPAPKSDRKGKSSAQ